MTHFVVLTVCREEREVRDGGEGKMNGRTRWRRGEGEMEQIKGGG